MLVRPRLFDREDFILRADAQRKRLEARGGQAEGGGWKTSEVMLRVMLCRGVTI